MPSTAERRALHHPTSADRSVLFLCSREDLIERTLTDVKAFERATAEAEVDKMLLDSEALKVFIQFQKMIEQDPDFKVPEEREEDGEIH